MCYVCYVGIKWLHDEFSSDQNPQSLATLCLHAENTQREGGARSPE